MKLRTQQLTSSLAIAGLALVSANANAAPITWQSSVDLYQGVNDGGFVDTAGNVAVAYNATATVGGTTTVNGVTFTNAQFGDVVTGVGTETIRLTPARVSTDNNQGAFGDGSFSSNVDNVFDLIGGASFRVEDIILEGLSIGTQYQIQVITNDARRNDAFKVGFSDGVSAANITGVSDLNNNPASGGGEASGDYILGTFTATAASMSIRVTGTNNGTVPPTVNNASEAQVNAVQLRVVPEPGSLALLSLGGLLIARRRRG